VTSGQFAETRHRLLNDLGEGIKPGVLRLASLEKHVRILRGTAQHRVLRRQGTATQGNDLLLGQQRLQDGIVERRNLGHFVRGAETIEEMQHRDPTGQRRRRRNGRHVMRLLHRIGRQQCKAGRPGGHHVGMVAEDRQRVCRDGTCCDMEDGRRQFAGNLVHVGDHQQQPLRRGERRGQRAGLQRAMHGTRRPAFGLQFDDAGYATPDIEFALCRPFIGQLAHAGRRGNRVDGDHFGNAEGHVGDGFVAIDGEHVFHGVFLMTQLHTPEGAQPG